MTTATMATHGRTMDATARPGRSLEELVDRLMAALFSEQTETAGPIHEARRLSQAGEIDGALAALAGVDMGRTTQREARWAFSEWRQLVKRRFGDRDALVYSQGAGRAAALVPHDDGTLEVVAALGMGWKPGKIVS